MARDSHPIRRSPRSAVGAPARRDTDQLIRRAVEQHRSGDVREAERLYRKALKADPKNREGRRLLAVALRDLGRDKEAMTVLDPLADEFPEDPQLQHMAADLSLRNGRPKRSLRVLERCAARPGDLGKIALHARAESAVGDHVAAENRLREALDRAPDEAALVAALASVLSQAGRLREAIGLHRRLAEMPEPGIKLAARSQAAALLRDLGGHEEALGEIGQALEVMPEGTALLRNRALFLRELGRVDEAVEALRRSIAIDPEDTETRQLLAWTRNHRDASEDDEDLAWWRARIEKPESFGLTKYDAWFAWARILGQLGRRDEEIAFLQRANKAHKRAFPFDLGAVQRRYRAIRERFDAETLAGLHSGDPVGSSDETPVFIVGLPRSGGTLVEQILSSHSQVHGAGELPDLERVLTGSGLVPGGDPLQVVSLDAESRVRVAEAYLARIRERSVDAARIVDKQPHNYEQIGAILTLFPNARIIHVRRDPRDCAASILKHQFAGDLRYAYDPRDLSSQFGEYLGLCDHWRTVVPEQNLLEVRYESIVENVEVEARRLIDFLGLGWEPRCLEFYRSERVVSTLSAEQVRQPIYRSSMGSWEAYTDLLGPALDSLGAAAI